MNTFSFFWYDRLVADRNDVDSPEVEGLGDIADRLKAVQVRSVPIINIRNCLVLVHAQGLTTTQWEEIADPSENRYVVLVGTVARQSNKNGVYCPRTPLTSIAKFLKDHPDKIESFKKSCEESKPDWSVFEPVVYPENLVAAYLACIAKDINQTLNFTGILGAQVQSEFEKQWNLHKPDGPKYSGDWLDAALNDTSTSNRTQLRNSLHSLFQKVHDEQKRK